ncbi:hypothetical protein ABF162_07445 [Vibrio coralliilyticus]|uniref:hypothetical protein n=1 Tax=Vibrio coralliilyticus TaxID=190893 RepID=UPI0005127F79|nr:hypothetical protein [Vibrio coralliilyticus]AIU66860.1 hypothetical protein JV59_31435 [Vibrio coralliilyticus]
MQASPQLNRRLVDLGFVVLGGVLVWLATRQIAKSFDNAANKATAGAGQALSDLFAKFNGWEPVTLQPLMIRDFYLTSDKRLTQQAESTLWKIDDYKPLLSELFGTQGGQLKPQYQSLINVEITKGNIDV